MNAVSGSENSTNVRSQNGALGGLRAARLAMRFLGPIAPPFAAIVAERLFLSPARPRRPDWERTILENARRSELATPYGAAPIWIWDPESGTDAHGTRAQEPPVVVLAHGWCGRGSQLGEFVAPLTREGFRVVAFDGPGHGDAPSRFASLVTQACAIATVLARFGPVHAVIGHSVGAAAAVLAARYSAIAGRYVLLAPPLSPARFIEQFSRVLAVSSGIRRRMVHRVEERYQIRVDELDIRSIAAEIDRPAMIVHDDADGEIPFEDGQALAASWPHSRLTSVSGLGHRRILRAPNVIADVVEFVKHGGPAEGLRPGTLEGDLFFRDTRRTTRA